MNFKSVKEILTAIKNKDVSVIELTSNYLDKIKERDNELNCFITLTEEFALNKARKIDEEIAKNKVRALSGLPIAQKDIFCTKNIKTSCGSKMLDNFVSPYNATVIEKLNNAGTIMLGKTNMDEFAMGSSNETSFYGPVKNPWDTEYVPWWVFWRVCICGCSQNFAMFDRNRHWRINQTACLTVWNMWIKTDLWKSVKIWNDCICIKFRSSRYFYHRRT